MSFLLDTNVLCEPARAQPSLRVLEWLEQNDEDRLFVSAATLAEIHHGIHRLPQGNRRRHLETWVETEFNPRFAGRIIPIEDGIAAAWGMIVAQREAAGRPISTIDAFLAATARIHGLCLVTRNEPDFRGTVSVVNPWA